MALLAPAPRGEKDRTMTNNPIFCAIDTVDVEAARATAAKLSGLIGGIKLGLEFFTANGGDGVRRVMDGADLPLFLDLKFHDIPNTVAGAVRGISSLAPAFFTIHAGGGSAMMKAAVEAAGGRSKVLAVTILTSLSESDMEPLGIGGKVADQVKRLADLAQAAGVDGLVCSPHEVQILRAHLGDGMALVVPGIRPAGSATDDQVRTLTPAQALRAGADHLVIGRPITASADPAQAAKAILQSLMETA
jgi:orotidine-5'-phosphate decarboxylase